MARYIRIYQSPAETPGDVLGFSSRIADAAHDEVLHNWLRARGYDVTPESDEQREAIMYMAGIAVRTKAYHDAPGIPIPENTVSSGHLLVEPPLRDGHLRPLGTLLSKLATINDGGLRRHFLVNNRNVVPQQHDPTAGEIIAWWG